MPVIFEVAESNDLLITRFKGKITNDELVDSYKAFYSKHADLAGIPELALIADADFSELTSEGIRMMAQWEQDFHERHDLKEKKTALFISESNQNSSVAIIYEVFCTDSPEMVKIFENKDRAMRWLTEGQV